MKAPIAWISIVLLCACGYVLADEEDKEAHESTSITNHHVEVCKKETCPPTREKAYSYSCTTEIDHCCRSDVYALVWEAWEYHCDAEGNCVEVYTNCYGDVGTETVPCQ